MRVAAIDLGTNSTRLLVADVEKGRVTELVRRTVVTRLGDGVDERPLLRPDAIARVRSVLVDYRREAEALGAERALATATSAVRDAENGEAFLGEVQRSFGLETLLLSGDDEAELTLRGVTSDRALEPRTLVVDIGGGSTELVLGGPDGVDSSTSLQLGCVRMEERFLGSDPPTDDELASLAAHVRSQLPDLSPARAIGVAGTVTTLAALDLGVTEHDVDLIHRHVVPRGSVERSFRGLAAVPLAERERVPGLEPSRARVIVAGIAVLREILDAYSLDAVEASERDILHGAAIAAAELPPREEGDAPPQAFAAC
ncbi:MAG: Ppx/GppA family phosphatase [Thermoleophilia bacterium]|nr:Ppx/GppA family phosphatase [Thermoleophilia bacterium]